MEVQLFLLLSVAFFAVCNAASVVSPMWPNCELISTPFNLDPLTGGEYSAIGCTFSGYVTIGASSLNQIATASMYVAGGNVLPGPSNGIGISGPSADVAAMMGSMHITIQDMTFGQDAMLLFAGTLPPKSSLLLEGNSFFITQRNFNKNGGLLDIVGIQLTRVTLLEDANISVQHNIITGGSTSTADLKAISLESQFTYSLALTHCSSITVYNNTVANVASSSLVCIVSVLLYSAYSTNVVVSNGSALNINDNRMQNVTAWYVFVVGFTTPNNISVSNDSKICISGNSALNVKIMSSFIYAVYWTCSAPLDVKEMSIVRNSLINMSANSLTNISGFPVYTVFAVYLYWAYNLRTFILNQNASLELSDNLVANVGGNTNTNSVAVFWYWTLTVVTTIKIANGSQISCSRNTLLNVTMTTGIVVSWQWNVGAMMEITDFSAVRIDGNSLRVKTAMANWAITWSWYSSTRRSVSVARNSTISTNNNYLSQVIDNGHFIKLVSILWQCDINENEILITNGSSITANDNGYVLSSFNNGLHLTSWSISKFTLTLDFGSRISSNNGTVMGNNAAVFDISSSMLSIGRGSYFEAAWNNFFGTGPQSSLVVFYSVWLKNGGSMLINNNSLSYGFPLLTFNGLAFYLQSNIGLVGNTITWGDASQPYFMIKVTYSVFREDGVGSSAIWMCENNIPWISSGDRNPNALVSSLLSGLASTCSPLPTTTTIITTTTTKPVPTTTKRPTTTTTTTTTTKPVPTTTKRPTTTTTTTTKPTTTKPTTTKPRTTTKTSTTTTVPPAPPSPNMNVGILIAIIVTSVAIVLLSVVLVIKCCCRRKHRNHSQTEEPFLPEGTEGNTKPSEMKFQETHQVQLISAYVPPDRIYMYSPAPPAQPYTYSVPTPINGDSPSRENYYY